jgi:uncharacterized protein YpuA (DUF1002 family)
VEDTIDAEAIDVMIVVAVVVEAAVEAVEMTDATTGETHGLVVIGGDVIET